uniref:EF-hand domain-containing protein n=1 Tax=Octactis speculum TaxID=3111310 RepID=A0A7S2CZF6_9STRA|mmetsp:Transcript_40883/g.55685  ORF Transcript_40883/g.55685 Transcript_40883/m.55685 type:complete len:241 (+) Transcript_40883:46-768(+)|eukprot:CAMPEP_0185767650 /NCGR_PEP_ID=MMETSP1174-20130828/45468_1 /TAXON_ID=35687 /ORGANISM="Dictyocha speculum, Strain CCMP1381" /LENGTH=240 /DNA_ID=CAMNT_0028451971 /DNA_START=46 /DNA_END=768 /DNA_ORIENTATION=-
MGNGESQEQDFDVDHFESLEQIHHDDADHMENYTLDELKCYVKNLNLEGVTDDYVEEYFEKADEDKNGTLDEDELRAVVIMLQMAFGPQVAEDQENFDQWEGPASILGADDWDDWSVHDITQNFEEISEVGSMHSYDRRKQSPASMHNHQYGVENPGSAQNNEITKDPTRDEESKSTYSGITPYSKKEHNGTGAEPIGGARAKKSFDRTLFEDLKSNPANDYFVFCACNLSKIALCRYEK